MKTENPKGSTSEPCCPKCGGDRVIQINAAGAGHSDDLAEYEWCGCVSEQPATPSPEITVIKLQSEYPRDFVCYECKDNNHTHCVGVPCNCKCPAQPALEPADQSSTGKELVWMDESHGRWAVFVGNVFCGYELSEERAKDKVSALLEAIQESHDHQ